MSDMSEDQRRSAERIELKVPIEATLVDVPARIVEISLMNCRLEHSGKVAMGSNVTLQFQWRGEKIRLKGKLTRSEMRPIGGKLGYISAMQLADSLDDAPPPLRRMIASLLGDTVEEAPPPPPLMEPPPPPKPAPKQKQTPPKPALKPTPAPKPAAKPPAPKPQPPPPPPFLKDEEIEEIEADAEILPARYIECILSAGKWTVREVSDPKQPREGFTMIAPDIESDIHESCKTYEMADPDTRKMIRLAFELAIARQHG
jgi:hypothetical protein